MTINTNQPRSERLQELQRSYRSSGRSLWPSCGLPVSDAADKTDEIELHWHCLFSGVYSHPPPPPHNPYCEHCSTSSVLQHCLSHLLGIAHRYRPFQTASVAGLCQSCHELLHLKSAHALELCPAEEEGIISHTQLNHNHPSISHCVYTRAHTHTHLLLHVSFVAFVLHLLPREVFLHM